MDTFYNIQELSLSQKIKLLSEYKEIYFNWWVEDEKMSSIIEKYNLETMV